MDTTTYSNENLRQMIEKGLPIPPSCMDRAIRLGLIERPGISQRIIELKQSRKTTVQGRTPQEAAKLLGPKWTAKKIRKWIRKGKIPATKIGNNWYIPNEWFQRDEEPKEG